MSIQGIREQCPENHLGTNVARFVPASRNGFRIARNVAFLLLGLVVFLLSGNSHGAEVVPECEARSYKSCPTFLTTVTIGRHEEIIDNSLAGFTRSDGSWTIDVRYQPEGSCAVVKMLLNIGPIDFPRSYERTFMGGGGQVRDSGRFMHKTGDPEGSLRLLSSSCFVPAELSAAEDGQPSHSGGETKPNQLDVLLERLARGEQGEPQDLDDQLERLVSEERRAQRAAQERERRRAEQEQERKRLAQQQREQDEALRLLAERRRAAELRRHQDEQEDAYAAAQSSDLNSVITAFGFGALVGGAITGDDEMFDAADRAFSHVLDSPYVPSGSDSSGGSGCEQIGARLARDLDSLSGSNSMCTIYRGTAQAYGQARNELAATGCATSQELEDLDQAIRQAVAGARASCGGS